jgi:type I restriction enzyme S subunit
LPPRGEQERLADSLDDFATRLDAAAQSLARVEANLKRYRVSVLKAAVEGRLVPTEAELAKRDGRDYVPASVLLERTLKERRRRSEEAELARMHARGEEPTSDEWKNRYVEPESPPSSELRPLPEGWCWARAEQVSEFITKGTTPPAAEMNSGAGEIPYVKVYNLTFDGSLNFELNPTFVSKVTHAGSLQRSICRPGDVLMNIVGPPLGKVSIVPPGHPEWNINQAIARYRPVSGLSARFLSIVLREDSAARWAQRHAKATAGQFNLTLEIARDLPIPIPPENEQLRIVEAEQDLLSFENAWTTTIAAADTRIVRLRQSVLRWAFEGRLVDQDSNDEPATVLLERIRQQRANEKPRERRRQSLVRKVKTTA